METRCNAQSHRYHGDFTQRFVVVILGLVLLGSGGPAFGDLFVSTQSGPWTSAATWGGLGVPGSTDDVVVSVGHAVGAAGAGGGFMTPTCLSLTVNGTLTAASPEAGRGRRLRIYTTMLTNNGTIRGESGARRAGSVFLSTIWTPVPWWRPVAGTFINNGTIVGGNTTATRRGGNVRIFYVNGTATNNGTIRGGDGATSGGNARLSALIVVNNNILRGGDGASWSGGAARLRARSIPIWWANPSATNAPGALVRGGDGDEGFGGNATVISTGMLPAPATNAMAAVIRGGDACRGGWASLFGTPTTNAGVVSPGTSIPELCPDPPRRRRTRIDPPDGVITGDAEITGDVIELAAGSSLTIGGLVNPFPIHAEEDLVITLAPGGVLDLRDNPAGTTVLSANDNVIINADEILLDEGVSLSDIVTGSVITQNPGDRYSLLDLPPDAEYAVDPGDTFELFVDVGNIGNMSETVELTIDDTEGWCDYPSYEPAYLEAMESLDDHLEIQVPEDAAPGTVNVITLHAYAPETGAELTSEIQLVIPELGEPGDMNCDGVVNFFDIDGFVLALTDPAGYVEAYPDCDAMLADVNGDGSVDFFDIDAFVMLIMG